MERETKKIKTPSGKEVELKTYLTARERNELRNIFLKGMTVEPSTAQVKEISGELIEEAERKLIELAVVSFDNSAENIIGRILDGTPEDYDFIVSEANKISTGNFTKAK
ncbi:MAG: hypothetical protein KatS3mg101_1107 [Patescibacteria group bacterium]|nr:MAG: hypothetical protein KatS3mg101_1107 [Patescibacteria group bacterium]